MNVRILAVLLGAVLSVGCVSHRARIENPSGASSHATVGGSYLASIPEHSEYKQQLPQDILVSAWRWDDEAGVIYRADGRCRTPLSWWQRFPADLVSDIMVPRDLVCEQRLVLAFAPIGVEADNAWLTTARQDGYFHGNAPTHEQPLPKTSP